MFIGFFSVACIFCSFSLFVLSGRQNGRGYNGNRCSHVVQQAQVDHEERGNGNGRFCDLGKQQIKTSFILALALRDTKPGKIVFVHGALTGEEHISVAVTWLASRR